jgi:hypothetical protein
MTTAVRERLRSGVEEDHAMIPDFLSQVLAIMKQKGKEIESYRMNDDAVLAGKVREVDHHGGVCLSLVYRWIRRQLKHGKEISPQSPAFTEDRFTEAKKKKVAENYRKYKTQLDTIFGHKNAESKSILNSLAEAGVLPPVSAMISEKDQLMCRVIACDFFGQWGSTAAGDATLKAAFGAMEQAIEFSAQRENDLQGRLGHSGFDYLFNQSGDFFGVFSVKGQKGHAMGLRCEGGRANGRVHFFDPNIGYYQFDGFSDMLKYLCNLWLGLYGERVEKEVVYPEAFRFNNWVLTQFRRRSPDSVHIKGEGLDDVLWENCTNECFVKQKWMKVS